MTVNLDAYVKAYDQMYSAMMREIDRTILKVIGYGYGQFDGWPKWMVDVHCEVSA